MNSGLPIAGPTGISTHELARCSGTGVPIRGGEVYYRHNGRAYCAEEITRMFPEVFDLRQKSFNTLLGWGGIIGAPLAAGVLMYVAMKTGASFGRAGGLISLVMLSVMYSANRHFLAPATKARQEIERIGTDGSVELLG